MYRVDVYAHQGDKDPLKLLSPLYACLGTAGNESKDGRLLTVGRKNATILLDKDKSVSRDHTHLHLISNQEEHQKVAGVASNAEETEACAQSSLGLALLVKNLGKFGTTIVALSPKNISTGTGGSEATPKTKADNATDGSDTEDESQQINSQIPVDGSLPDLPDVTWFEKTQEINKKLKKSHKIVLAQKLQAKQTKAIPGHASTILLQCGGSGSLLVLTRMEIQFCKSQWPIKLPKGHEALMEKLYTIGAQVVDDQVEEELLKSFAQQKATDPGRVLESPLPPTTYLITSKRDTAPKQLVAFSLQFPMATLDYMEALVNRKTPEDPWPNHKDFDPPSKDLHKDIDESFWHTETSPRLWQSCTFLSASDKLIASCEYIVRAAGGTVYKVYEHEEEEAKEYIQKLMDDPDKKDGVFASSSSGSRKKIVKWIKNQKIPHIPAKEITLTLCRQELLRDAKNRVIGKAVAELEQDDAKDEEETPVKGGAADDASDTDATVEGAEEPKLETKADKGKSSKRKSNALEEGDDVDRDSSKDEERYQSKAKRSRGNSKPLAKNENLDDEHQADNAKEVKKRQSQKKRSHESGKSDDSDLEENVREAKRSRSSQSATKTRGRPEQNTQSQRQSQNESQRNVEILPSVQEEDSMILNESMPMDESTNNKQATGESEGKTSVKEEKANKKRAKASVPPSKIGSARLETTDDGWLVAAPKDAVSRQAYLRPLEEIIEGFQGEGQPPPVAETETKQLVHRAYDPTRNRIAGIRAKSSVGPNFKKFRKNSVLCGPRTVIELRSVLPKESERQRELEEQQRRIDEQERRADELFNVGSGKRQTKIKKTTTRRRRS